MSKLPGWNEDTVKSRLVLPYLQRLGFAPSELHFEEVVELRIGRRRQRLARASGRLDIRVARGGANLFLVEAKAEGLELTDDDRDQAISYARLLEPMAPVVLLTNGSQHRLIASVSRRDLTDDETRVGSSAFSLTLPADLKAAQDEALEFFLGYSRENLLTFCRQQAAESMATLKGSDRDRKKKYIPDVFVQRKGLTGQVADFLAGPKSLFPLVGDAGTGKTCCLCGLAENLLDRGHPLLFYRGFHLPGEILGAIADDFNWSFPEEQSAPQLVRRLAPILRDRPLIIVIDAVDEWEIPRRVQDLLASARRLSGRPIKLILSCKSSVWNDFRFRGGTPTGLDEYSFSPRPDEPYVVLAPLNEMEFLDLVERYGAFYGVTGVFEDAAWREAHTNLFLLRILFEVAGRQHAQHLTFSSLEFFESYYDQSLATLDSDRRGADLLLQETARLLYQTGQDRLDVSELRRAANFADFDRLLSLLLNHRLLESFPSTRGEGVTFYFSLLRDYLVAFRVHHWQDRGEEQLAGELAAGGEADVQREAVAFFYRHAVERQRRLLDGPCFVNAVAFTRLYDEVLGTDFHRLRPRFPPFTAGDLGFVGELDLRERRVFFYGFRPRDASQEEVLFLPIAQMQFPRLSNLAELHGAVGLHHATDFRAPNIPQEVMQREVGRTLRRLVDLGDLDESACPELAAEVVATLVASNRQIFSEHRHVASAGPLFPIDLGAVRRWLRYELLREHFDEVRQSHKLRSGEIQATSYPGGAIGYSWEPTVEDLAWIEAQARAHIGDSDSEVRQAVARSIESGLAWLDRRMLTAIETLEAYGITTVENHPFPRAAELSSRSWTPAKPSFGEVKSFLEELLPTAFGILRRLVAHNFPTMTEDFFSNARQPLLGIVRVLLDNEPRYWSGTLFLCAPDADATADRFAVREWRSLETRILRDPSFRFELCLDGHWRVRLETEDAGLVQRNIPLPGVFRPRHDYLNRQRFTSVQPPYPVVRAMVYDLLRCELPTAFRQLCRRYKVTRIDTDWSSFARAGN
jgi:hypothetical protein